MNIIRMIGRTMSNMTVVSVLAFLAGSAQGALENTWTNLNGGAWSTAGNWSGGANVPGANAGDVAKVIANFTAARIVTNDAAILLGGLLVGDSTSSWQDLALTNSGAGQITFTNNGNNAWLATGNNASTATNTVYTPIYLGDNLLVTNATTSSGRLILAGNIAETRVGSSMTIDGPGLVQMKGSNSFSGGLSLHSGTLSVQGYTNLPAAGGLNFSGGILQVTGTIITNLEPYTVNWGSFSGGLDVNDAGNTLTVTNTIVGAGTLTKKGAGALVFSSNTINLSNVLTVTQGSLTLNNANLTNSASSQDLIGNLAGSTGTLTLQGNSVFARTAAGGYSIELGKTSGSKGVLVIQDSATLSPGGGRNVNIAAYFSTGLVYMYGGIVTNGTLAVGLSGVGALYQTNGVIAGSTKIDVGSGGGAYGYYQLSGGISSNTVKSFLGGPAGSIGIQYQSGGSSYWGDFRIGYSGGSTSVLYLTGGTYAFSGLPIRMNNEGGKSVAQLTVAGTAFLNGGSSYGINMNNGTWAGCGSGTDIVNLLGGTAQVSQVYKTVGDGLAILNFNGGTLRAGRTGDLFGTGTNAPDAVYVYSAGATIDSSTFIITNASPLLAPGGSGVVINTSLNLGNYVGAPYVDISGGGGTGATAVSQFDYISGTVTGFVVASPGVGYISTPVVRLMGGGNTNYAITSGISLASNTSGGLTKLGSGRLVLATNNTYRGATVISNGVLSLSGPNCLSSNTAVYIYSGATNNLNFIGTNIIHALYINGVLLEKTGVYGTNNLAGFLSGPGYLQTTWPPAKGTLVTFF